MFKYEEYSLFDVYIGFCLMFLGRWHSMYFTIECDVKSLRFVRGVREMYGI